jgi:hypothetical protein
VPVAVLVAVAVLAVGGGVGGVSRLGQLFSGPAVPSPLQATPSVDAHGVPRAALPHIPARIVAAAAPAAASVRATPVRHSRGAPRHAATPRPIVHRSPTPSRQVGPQPKPITPAPPTTTVSPPPPPPTPPRKTITRRVGDSLNRVVRPLPLVGPTAARAIDAVVTTVDKVLPLPPVTTALHGLVGR